MTLLDYPPVGPDILGKKYPLHGAIALVTNNRQRFTANFGDALIRFKGKTLEEYQYSIPREVWGQVVKYKSTIPLLIFADKLEQEGHPRKARLVRRLFSE